MKIAWEELDERIMDLNDAKRECYNHGTKREKVPWPKVPRDFDRFKKDWEKSNEVSVKKRKRVKKSKRVCDKNCL